MKKSTLFFIIISSLLLHFQILAQKSAALPRSTPEAEGVSSEAILQFLDAASSSKHEFHSFVIVRHGKVVAEGWWNPYRPDLKHTMYSVSKSFAATAVGFAVAEQKLTVEDKVVSFFPNDLPETVSPNLAALRVKDLLSMSVGQEPDPTGAVVTSEKNWVKTFLNTPIVHQPGTKFLYNSAATFMLSAIVQKVTGEKILDYLKPRLFEPLGINGIDWETNPEGINVGGWGLRLKTEDMAKFGQLFLQKGKWNGKQILPAAWVEEASTMKIMQNPDAPKAQLEASDWLQGYCYQMWRSRHNSYRGDGANGQYILVLPALDAVIAITSESPDMQDELNLIWKYLLPAFKDNTLPANPKMLRALKTKSAALALAMPAKSPNNSIASTVSGKTFTTASNTAQLQSVNFTFKKGTCELTLKDATATYTIPFGSGKWALSETKRYGPYLVAAGKNNRVGLPPFKTAGSYTWKDGNTLELTLRYIESPHTETIICRFDNNTVALDFQNVFNKNAEREMIKGVLK